MILIQQRKQAKIGFETFRSKYIKLCVCQWVKESWQELSKEMVERSFKKEPKMI